MKTVLVTGATGLLGSRACEQLIERGDEVRALVRNPDADDAKSLAGIGVKVIPGDVSDMDAVMTATKGVEGVIHSAAMLGRPGASVEVGYATNLLGTLNVQSAAFLAGNVPLVQVLTTTFFDMWEKPLTEHSPLDLAFRNRDTYTVTKRLGYCEGMTRVGEGQDIRFMLPGAIYGPSVCVNNAMISPNFNERLVVAINGDVAPTMPIPVPYSMADDCAFVCIAALDKGRAGERYIAHGRREDVGSIAAICNLACEIAGVDHRIEEVPRDKLHTPEVIARFGETLVELAGRSYPEPFSDSTFTQERLGYVPTPLRQGLEVTIAWFRARNLI